MKKFQSTLSEGRATSAVSSAVHIEAISIHALRGESDLEAQKYEATYTYFNPRSPRGERRYRSCEDIVEAVFQSTLSEGRATVGQRSIAVVGVFQSTLSEGRATANISKMLRGGLDRFPNF